jgi:hypothetical protein
LGCFVFLKNEVINNKVDKKQNIGENLRHLRTSLAACSGVNKETPNDTVNMTFFKGCIPNREPQKTKAPNSSERVLVVFIIFIHCL